MAIPATVIQPMAIIEMVNLMVIIKTDIQNGRSNQELAGISEKQLDLINNIVRQNNLNKADIENLSVDLFGGGVRTLNKMQASNFIDELFERYPKQTNGQRSFQSTRA